MYSHIIRTAALLTIIACGQVEAYCADKPELVRVYRREAGVAPLVGEFRSESGDEFEVYDLKSHKVVQLSKNNVREIKRNISEESASTSVGLPNVIAWRVKVSVPLGRAKGKVAKVDLSTVYINVGAKNGIQPGDEFQVYRGSKEVRDPDSGKVLDRQRRLIARIAAAEVRDSISKCKLLGNLEIELRAGDEVESSKNRAVAVLPLKDERGDETNAGQQLAEQVTAGLVEANLPVVERSQLADVLSELDAQQFDLFDKSSAQQLGKQLGAAVLVLGTTRQGEGYIEANVRLVKVDSGEILLACAHKIPSSDVNDGVEIMRNTNRTDPSRPSSNNLIGSIELPRDVIKGNWRKDSGTLIFSGNANDGMITVPKALPMTFVLQLKCVPAAVTDSTCIAVYRRIGGVEYIAQLARDGSCVIVGARDPRADRTARYGDVFKAGKSNLIVYSVTRGLLTVDVNGKRILKHSDDQFGRLVSENVGIGILGDWKISEIALKKAN